MVPQDFSKRLLDATMQVLLAILKIILLPFSLWVKAATNLAEQREKGLLDLNTITGLCPFFTFCKRLILDFLLDAIAFLSYPIGVLMSVVAFVMACVETYDVGFGVMLYEAARAFLYVLILSYCTPIFTTIINNTLQFLLLPIRKFIDWCKKPAQQLDVNAVQEVKVNKEE